MNLLQQTLKSAREQKDLSQQEIANQCTEKGKKISRQFYSMIENGDRRPSVDVAKTVAEILGVEWTIFFEYKSN
ncbi:helix-turn-helix transcriptional regulator [Priestia aryabhattai]|uniref:helix-turn-helix transcriptional regulator n=1 Tax=Priestia aryabhattai TaxID=412384 RepID=UPI003D2B7349